MTILGVLAAGLPAPAGPREAGEVKFTRKNRAAIAFELEWKSSGANHRERILIPKADLWRDVVHPEIEEAVTGAEAGDIFELSWSPGPRRRRAPPRPLLPPRHTGRVGEVLPR